MNAIISLCHFCEVHGPSVLLSTQAFHEPEVSDHIDDSEVFSTAESLGSVHSKSGPKSLDCINPPWKSDEQLCKAGSSSAPSSPTSSCPERLKPDNCEACSPFTGNKLGYVSHDSKTQFCYISSHHPRHPEVFSIVKQACIRSLSGEICPDPDLEGPVFFGEEHRTQVLSYTFMIKDSIARGQKRKYSIIVVMMDKTFLLNSWPFLVKHIRLITDDLKKRSDAIFCDELAHLPSRVQRSKACPSAPMTTDASYRLQRGAGKNKMTRSLTELTGDELVFNRLHSSFTWLLKAGGMRLTERLLEGPPTEGCVLDVNRLEETEEGFVKVYSKVGMTVDVKIHRAVDSDTAILSSLFSQLKKFAQILGRDRFHVVAHHLLIGDQVVVRSPCKLTAHTILDCLKILLPKGCCRIEYYSDVYIQSYKCNLLGIKPSVDVPLDTALCILIEVSDTPTSDDDEAVKKSLPAGVRIVLDRRTPDEVARARSDSDSSLPESPNGPHSLLVRVGSAEEIVDLSTIHYRVLHAPERLASKEPSLLDKVEKVLFTGIFDDSVAELSLRCLKDDWMMKAKRMFMFAKLSDGRSAEEMMKFNQVIDANVDDKIALRFWMSGLPGVEYQLNNSSTVSVAEATKTSTHHFA